jgi:hypothetical protein
LIIVACLGILHEAYLGCNTQGKKAIESAPIQAAKMLVTRIAVGRKKREEWRTRAKVQMQVQMKMDLPLPQFTALPLTWFKMLPLALRLIP